MLLFFLVVVRNRLLQLFVVVRCRACVEVSWLLMMCVGCCFVFVVDFVVDVACLFLF